MLVKHENAVLLIRDVFLCGNSHANNFIEPVNFLARNSIKLFNLFSSVLYTRAQYIRCIYNVYKYINKVTNHFLSKSAR